MWINGMLIALITVCLITDLRHRKIYNAVLLPALIIALLWHYVLGGWPSLGHAVLAFMTGFSVLLIPYLLGGMGAGDVKLLAVIGAFKGIPFVLAASVYMALFGGAAAAIILLFRRGAGRHMQWLAYWLYALRYGVKIPLYLQRQTLSATYPYGAAIAGGVFVTLWIQG